MAACHRITLLITLPWWITEYEIFFLQQIARRGTAFRKDQYAYDSE